MANMSPRETTAGITIHYPYNSHFAYNEPVVFYNYASTAGKAFDRERLSQRIVARLRVAAVSGGNAAPRFRLGSSAAARLRGSSTMKGR